MRTDPIHSYFQLTDHLEDEQITEQIFEDQNQMRRIAQRLDMQRQEVTQRIALRGQDSAGALQQSLERDVDLHQMARRLHSLERLGPDACLGFMVDATTGQRTYVGRAGLADENSHQLLVDWRAPAAEPFFAATHAHPMNLSSRRRYRWRQGVIVDFWDEVFDLTQLTASPSLDEHSSFLASLGASRIGKMQDVLSTIQADQDAIIRTSAKGALVVDGGPGTGKTVVALHRAAYLLHADAQLQSRGGRVLVLGPHDAYTAYVSDILPNLGEEEVLVSTLQAMVPEIRDARTEDSAQVAGLKTSGAMLDSLSRAVSVFEQPPAQDLLIETRWADLRLTVQHWENAFAGVVPGSNHNESRIQIQEALEELLIDQLPEGCAPEKQVRGELAQNIQLAEAFEEHWPLLDPTKLLCALYSIPALLSFSAPWLTDEQRQLLLREDPSAFTVEDGPLLDAARFLVGDPDLEFAKRRREALLSAERDMVSRVIDDLISAADDMEDLSSQLRHSDLQNTLIQQRTEEEPSSDVLVGPFAHVIIDEAQDLTEAQWAMVLRRCPSGSLTIVGDRAQAAGGFTETWEQRLAQAGISECRVASLSVNYRTTQQVMDAAESVIREQLPDANVPTSIRTDGAAVIYAKPAQQQELLRQWQRDHPMGVGVVIGDPTFSETDRIRSLSPEHAKGLEFDLVVLNRPENFGQGISGAVHRYVAMTRATAQLIILTDQPR
ncbi:RNA polymerase recycling motor ATPase HelR [Glutamicibacter arilaitensis]|uniref:RNA polymerase recycling motor ATPase HelR n=1 Tax=Glutamicibacter arilaitensis TaxID=256701 RepID=UPI003850526D